MTGGGAAPRHHLAGELRRLRDIAGVSGRELAVATGISQSTISRVEAGTRLPTRPEVTAWANAVGADDDTRQQLLLLTEAVHTAAQPFRQGDVAQRQDQLRGIEAEATRVRNFQPTLVPGLLQIAEYARRLMPVVDPDGSRDDHAAAVASRLRRQEVLYDDGRRWEFLLTERALLWPPMPPAVLAAQLDRIANLATLEHISIGLLFDTAMPVAPWHNYVIYERDGDAVVHVELTHASLTISEPGDIGIYQRQYDQLLGAAVYGPAASREFARIRETARKVVGPAVGKDAGR